MIDRLKEAHRQYQAAAICQDEEEEARRLTAQERLKMPQHKVTWKRRRISFFFKALRELDLHGAIQTSTRVAGLLPLVPKLAHLRIRTSSVMVLDMKAILSHCRPLEVFQVEAIGFNNAIQVLGGWRPITTTSVKCKTKDASPTYLASLSLRSFVLRRAIFDQSSLEDVLEHTPYLEELHLIHLVPRSTFDCPPTHIDFALLPFLSPQ
jgi:hypothetical protein